MLHVTEFETKFQFTSKESVELTESELAVDWQLHRHQHDDYYDTDGASLFLRGIFIRIRDASRVQFKFNFEDVRSGISSGHTVCSEFDFSLELNPDESATLRELGSQLGLRCVDVSSFKEFFAQNNLQSSIVLDKTRRAATGNPVSLFIDHVVGLGDFLEVESSGALNESSEGRRVIEICERLMLAGHLSAIDTGYNALYWRKHDFDLYKRCPYVMNRDLQDTELEHACPGL